ARGSKGRQARDHHARRSEAGPGIPAGVLPARPGARRGAGVEPERDDHRPVRRQAHRPAGHERAQPARAADRAEVLRPGPRGGDGEGGEGPSRGVQARGRYALAGLTARRSGWPASAASPSRQLEYRGVQPSSRLAFAFEEPRMRVIHETGTSPARIRPTQTGTWRGGFAPIASARYGSHPLAGAGSLSTTLQTPGTPR